MQPDRSGDDGQSSGQSHQPRKQARTAANREVRSDRRPQASLRLNHTGKRSDIERRHGWEGRERE